jgi:hypothetical protein
MLIKNSLFYISGFIYFSDLPIEKICGNGICILTKIKNDSI